MKKMRKLIPAFSMLLVAAIMLSTASYAWFTMGTTAEATGMQVTATTASALLIVDGDKVTAGDEYTAFKNATNAVDMSVGRTHGALEPATAYDSTTHTNVTTTNNLVTLDGFDAVNSVTGAAPSGAKYIAAAENANFVEYIVYIASGATALNATGNTLCATVTYNGQTMKYIDNALSIQFNVYTGKSEETAKTETINFKQVDNATNKALVVNLGAESVPNAFETDADTGAYTGNLNDYIKVVMRVYYDGALVDDQIAAESTTYLRNEKMVDLTSTGFNIDFSYQQTPTGDNVPSVQ